MHVTGERWRLGHRPALDGLRGVAVLIVVIYHAIPGSRASSGGIVGVTLFFALSGFLITGGLLQETDRTRSVSVAGFYLRRALRLLPALVVMLAIVGSVSIVAGNTSPAGVLAILFYGANWWQASGHGLGVLLNHTWTLSVEEQFYLLWPLAFLAAHRSRRFLPVLIAAALLVPAGRIVFAAAGGSPGLVYFTAGDALIAGCALAVWMHGRRIRWRLPRVAVLAFLAALVVVSSSRPPVSVTLAIAAVLGTLGVGLAGGAVGRVPVLDSATLRAIGRRSYGMYLWHLPVRFAVEFGLVRAGVNVWVAIAVGFVVLVGVTELSWRLIEQPAQAWGRRVLRLRAAGIRTAPRPPWPYRPSFRTDPHGSA